MILNETPVRTSNNFAINNIKLPNIKIPEKLEKFEDITIKTESEKNKIEENKEVDTNLKYGIEKSLTSIKANKTLKITLQSKQDEEIEIDYNLTKDLIDNIEILAKQDTKSTIIIKYNQEQDINLFHNGIIKVNTEKGSKINIIIINLINTISTNFLNIQNNLSENSKLNYTIVDFGAANSITNYYSNISGKKATNTLNTIYLGTQNQLFDLNYIAELKGQKSNVDIQVQGALKDNATKHFKGTIDFQKGCQKATGNETEFCMLLSDTAKSLALPMLLCSEEDVQGTHASSAGKVEEKELFYIMSRGFNEKEALNLLVKAKFNKLIQNIKNQQLKDQILKQIDNKLN